MIDGVVRPKDAQPEGTQVNGVQPAGGQVRANKTTTNGIAGIAAQPGGGSFATLLNHVVASGKVEAASRQVEGAQPEGLEEAVASFEAFFIHHLVRSMRKTVPKGGLIDLGFAGETYEDMLDEALAQEMAKAGGIGLAKILLDQLS